MLYMMWHTCQWSMPYWPVTSLTTLTHALHHVTHLPVKQAILTCHFPLFKGVNTGGNHVGAEVCSQYFKLLTLSLTLRQLEWADSPALLDIQEYFQFSHISTEKSICDGQTSTLLLWQWHVTRYFCTTLNWNITLVANTHMFFSWRMVTGSALIGKVLAW